MISFHLKSLFPNVRLDQAIELILLNVYQEKKIKTSIPQNILRELLYLCTKEVHFIFGDGVGKCPPLGPLLTNIFMTSLEEKVIPTLIPYLCTWKRYVDDTDAYVNPKKVDFQFTFELEKNKQITFLDVLAKRRLTDQICVHRKEASTNLYINCNVDVSIKWKIGTLRNIFK